MLNLILAAQTFFIAFLIKMVVLTIIADSNDHTVHFRKPLGKSNYIRLLNCSLYNSWYNLRRGGEISLFDGHNNASVEIICHPLPTAPIADGAPIQGDQRQHLPQITWPFAVM